MDDRENALGDRLSRAPSLADRALSPAEARAEAERRLHKAWLSETARQTASVEEVAPVAPAPRPDPRTEILGQSWEESSNEPRWVVPRDSDWTIAHRAGGNAPQADQEWVSPSESNAAPAQRHDAPPAPQYVTPETRYAALKYVALETRYAAPQYTPQAPQYAAPQQATPQYAPQASQPPTPVAPQTQYAAPQYTPQAPQYAAPPQSGWTIAHRAGGNAPQADQEWVRPSESNAAAAQRYHAPQAPQSTAPQQATPQYTAPQAPQYAPQAPQYAAPQQATPQYAPQASQPFTPVAPQHAPSFPPSDDAALRGGVIENLEFARQRVEELRKLQEWRLGQERRVSEEIGRRNALAEVALDEELQARREAEEYRLAKWRAEARTQFERDLAREEAEFERRLADRRRDAEVEVEARLLRRIDDAARRAEALEKGRTDPPDGGQPSDPRLYVVRNAV